MLKLRVTLLTFLSVANVSAQTVPWPGNPGFPNVPQTAGALLSGPNAPMQGRTAIIAYHNGVVFTAPELPASQPGSDFQVRMWNLSNPSAPQVIDRLGGPLLGESRMPVNAHGYIHRDGYLVLGDNWPAGMIWSFRAQPGVPGLTREAFAHLGVIQRGDVFQPWYASGFWSYMGVGGNAELRIGGNEWNPGSQLLASWDHLGLTGVIGHPFIIGNLLIYASDQSRTGVATYDISNPQAPVLLDVLKTNAPGGYWPELWGGDGKLYVLFPYSAEDNGFSVVDLTDPTDLRLLADVPLEGDTAVYAQFQDEFGFVGSHKIDMRTLRPMLRFTPPAGVTIDISQFALPLGNLLVTGGIGEGQGMGVWAHQAEPDLRPPSVGYSIPRPGQTGYPLTAPISLLIHETLDTLSLVNGSTFRLRPLTGGMPGSALAGTLVFSFDDMLTFTPSAPLAMNTTYEVRLEGVRDAAGNAMPAYAYTFSTGASIGGNRPPQVTSLDVSAYPAAPAQSVNFSASGQDPDNDPLQYRFDFGDGTPKTAWSANASQSHSYANAGHYRITAQVRDPAGVVASRGQTLTVLAPPANTATQSAPLICHAPGRRVWTVNPDHDSISEINADTLTRLREIPVCDQPRAIARSASGQLWVSCHGDDRVVVVNEGAGTIAASIATGYGSAPFGVAMSPDGASAYVALSGSGRLRRYATATRTQNGDLALAPGARSLAVSANGQRVLVTRFLAQPNHSEVWDVNTATMALTRTLRIPKQGDVANRDSTASGKGVINYLGAIAFAPLSGRPFVTGTKPNSERGALIAAGADLDSDNTQRNAIVELDPDAGTDAERFRRGLDLDNSDSASGLGFSPFGDYLLITLQGDDSVLVLDALAIDANVGLGSMIAKLPTGSAPQGVCVDATTRRTFVHDFLGRSLTVLETDALFRSGSVNVPGSSIATTSSEPLSPQVLAGKRIFYRASDPRMSAEGYLSCASCHLDGGHDGRVWDFTGRGEGLRNTTTLLGRGGMGHGNVHWSGNFDEIQDFENDIRNAFGGSGFMSDADFAATSAPLGAAKAGRSASLDALAAYVGSLAAQSLPRSPHRNSDGSATALGLQGADIFQREGCSSCHAGAHYTDSSRGAALLHDVGTLRTTSGQRLGTTLTGIDTPTLLGAFATAPYFHDGSAPTLADVFRVAGGAVIAAESGAVSAGAEISVGTENTHDDTVRGRAYVNLPQNGRVTWSQVDGGSGGLGAIELRYSASPWVSQVTLNVNGTSRSVPITHPNNDPGRPPTYWHSVRVEDVALNAGSGNVVYVQSPGWFVAIDEITVTTAAHRTRAQPHRRVSSLPVAEQNALIQFLLELDGSGFATQLFADSFE